MGLLYPGGRATVRGVASSIDPSNTTCMVVAVRGRINGRHKAAKLFWIQERTALQMQLREAFPATTDSVRQFIDDVIEASPGSSPNLKSNKASLLLFLDDHRALAFRGFDFKRVKGDLTPTKFYEQWVAAENHRSPELVRQYLSTR